MVGNLIQFFPGQSAAVAEDLNANFNTLLGMIQALGGGQSLLGGSALGSSNVVGIVRANIAAQGIATGAASVTAFTSSLALNSVTGASTAGATVAGNIVSQFAASGTSTGLATVGAFTSATQLGTAVGVATVVGNIASTNPIVGTAIGTAVAVANQNFNFSTTGAAVGVATVIGNMPPSAPESASGTIVVNVGVPIVASPIPGSAATTGLNTFTLNSQGVVQMNGVADTNVANLNIVEMYYLNHMILFETSGGFWYAWASANNWTPRANPFPAAIAESVEGFNVITANTPILYASSVAGTAAAANSQVGTGLDSWTLAANPGVTVHNGVQVTTLTNVTQLYYHNHTLYAFNGSWSSWQTAAGAQVITPTSGGSVTDATGTVYSLDAGANLLKNGVAVNGGGGTSAITIVSGVLWAQDINSLVWYTYNGTDFTQQTGSPGNSSPGFVSATSPIPTTPTINIANIPDVQTNATFVVSGTYQAYPGSPSEPAIPVLQYMDRSGAFQAMPAPTVTATTWSFVHPAIASAFSSSPGFLISIRDANATAVTKISNAFAVFVPGVVTLISITLSNTTGTAGAGSVIGQIAVTQSPGTFNGTVSVTGTDSAFFSVNAGYQLVTSQVLAARSYSIGLTATESGAANSVSLTPITVMISVEAQNATSVTTVGPTIVGSSTPGTAGAQWSWALVPATTGNGVTLNGVMQTGTTSVKQIFYINHTLYYETTANAWFTYGGSLTSGQAVRSSSSSPIPVITLTNIEAGSGLTGFDNQVSTVTRDADGNPTGSATDNFVPTPGSQSLFLIQMFIAGTALSYANGPTNYTISGGAQQTSFAVQNTGTQWQLNGNGALAANTYLVNLTATY